MCWKRLDYVFEYYWLLYTLNSEHNWEDLRIQLRDQQKYIFNNHKHIMRSPIYVDASL